MHGMNTVIIFCRSLIFSDQHLPHENVVHFVSVHTERILILSSFSKFGGPTTLPDAGPYCDFEETYNFIKCVYPGIRPIQNITLPLSRSINGALN